MGLRINTNIPGLRALRNLSITDSKQAATLERLSTGLRINRGSDDPSGLVISEQLRGQISSLNKAVENSQNATNLISTADAALQQVSDLLTSIQNSVIFALNTGGSSPAQIAAEQDSVDGAISAIDRIAATTRYSDRGLLNGTVGFGLVGNRPTQLQNLQIRAVSFAPGDISTTFTVTIQRTPQRAEIVINSAVTVGSTTLRISGPRGTEDITVADATYSKGVADAVNSVAGFTGVYASGIGATAATNVSVSLFSEDYGLAQSAKIEIVAGKISGSGGTVQVRGNDGDLADADTKKPLEVGETVSDRGYDAQVLFAGQVFTGIGRSFSILTRVANIKFDLNPDQISSLYIGQPIQFNVGNTGLSFQLNELPRPTDMLSVGIDSVTTAILGYERYRDRIQESIKGVSVGATTGLVYKGGFLNSLKTGGDNDLTINPQNASEIVKKAINQVAGLRGFLGALQAGSIQPNMNSLGVAVENLSNSLSTIRDLDFAKETSAFTRNQILFQSGIAVLANANAIPQAALALLR